MSDEAAQKQQTPWRSAAVTFAVIAAVVIIFDQITKYWAIAALTDAFTAGPGETLTFGEKLSRFLWTDASASRAVTVISDFWHFQYVENRGAAWGFLSRSGAAFRTPLLLVVSLCAMVFIIAYFRKTSPNQRLLRLGLAQVFGGAVGNFLDRARLGYVIDFIDWHWYDAARWPTFNVADAAISIGVGMLLLDMLLQGQADKKMASGGSGAS